MKFSIVIPAYNEEQRLPPVLERYVAHFSKNLAGGFEILVVVNGSSDRTAEVAREIAARHSAIRVIEEPEKIGKGGAVIRGVEAAKGDRIGFVDADGATTAEEFYRLYQKSGEADGVVASRWKKGARVDVPQKGLRLLSSRLFNGLIRTLLGLRYSDTQCGAKIFISKAWKAILPDIGTTRFAFDVDLLYQLKRHGFQVLEEPTTWHDVEGSKVQVFNTSVEMFLAVVRMRLLHSPLEFTVRWYDRLLAKPVDFLLNDPLFRHTLLLMAASVVIAVGNIGFQMIVGRRLPRADYALLATFLALFAMLSRPLGTVAMALNRYISLLVKDGRRDVAGRLLFRWVLRMGGLSLLAGFVCLMSAHAIASWFHLDRVAPVVVSAFALPVVFLMPVLGGALQGLQRFEWSSLSNIINALMRVLLGGLLVVFLYPACGWALLGHVGGMYFAVGVMLVPLIPFMMQKYDPSRKPPRLRSYVFQSFFIQVGAAVLMTGDVVMVKHYLPGNTDFSYAATLGRMVAFVAISVAMALFPKVSSDGGFSGEHRRLYLRSQGYTSILIGAALAVCLWVPGWLLRVLFHIAEPSLSILTYTRWMAVIMALSTLLNINISLLLAQQRFRLLAVIVLCAVLYGGGACFYHDSATQIILFAGIANLLALVVTTAGIFVSKPGENE